MEHICPGAGEAASRRLHILIVDDDEDFHELLRLLLESEGHVVSTGCNGRDALELLHDSWLPDLIVTDLMMPVMTGAELAEALQSDARLARIPVIIASGSAHGDVEQQGSHRILSKTTLVTSLLEALDRQVAGWAQKSEGPDGR